MVADFKEVHGKTEATLYYDTTFCMGDFYVSSLLYRSSIFVGAPVMPLMMMIHERRTTDSHELMFRWLSKLTGTCKAVLVVDREQAISKAIGSVLPASTVVYCWNHILGDIRVCINSDHFTEYSVCHCYHFHHHFIQNTISQLHILLLFSDNMSYVQLCSLLRSQKINRALIEKTNTETIFTDYYIN